MGQGESLLSDRQLGKGQVLFIIFILVSLYTIHWYSSQITDLAIKSTAEFYLWLGILGLGTYTISIVASAKDADFDMITYSSNWLGDYEPSPILKTASIIGFVFLTFIVFLLIGNAPLSAVYSAPEFQVVELGVGGRVILTGLAAVIEEFAIIAPILGIIFFISYYFTKNRNISIILAIIGTGLVFGGLYHILRYGTTDPLATEKVMMMGWMSAFLAVVFRNLLGGMAIHVGNNMGIAFFRATGISSIVALSLLLPWILVMVLGLLAIWYFVVRDDGGAGGK